MCITCRTSTTALLTLSIFCPELLPKFESVDAGEHERKHKELFEQPSTKLLMLDSPPTPSSDEGEMPPRENEGEQENVLDDKDNLSNQEVHLTDDDDETAELSRLRCTSLRTEEIAEKEKQKKERRQNRCADYPGLAFGSTGFGSETMMKFSIIKNELHNIMRSQLKRVDGEVAALSQRVKALDENLAKSEQYIKTATAALADAVAMEVERRKRDGEDEANLDDNDPLSQFDAQMVLLEGKLLEAKFLAAKANQSPANNPSSLASSSLSVRPLDTQRPPPPRKMELRRPFPIPDHHNEATAK